MIISVLDREEKHRGKRRNCLYKQLLPFPQCFQKASFPDMSKGVIVWKCVKTYLTTTKSIVPTLYEIRWDFSLMKMIGRVKESVSKITV